MEEAALFKVSHGLYVLGSRDGSRYVGSLVDAIMQISHNPFLLAISCNNTSYTKECIEKENELSISILGKNIEPFVVANFGFQSSRNVDKWENVDFFEENNLPFISNNIAIISAKVLQKIVFGSNTLFIAEVVDCRCYQDEEPITYHDYRCGFKNDVIKAMADFRQNGINIKNKEIKMAEEEKKHVCSVCDYEYDGSEGPFEDLPDDYICPVCGVDKSNFS